MDETDVVRTLLVSDTANSKFPEKLSEWLAAALDDLERLEKSPRYRIRMSAWHRPGRVKKFCEICLAGAFMAGRFHTDPSVELSPRMYPKEIRNKLYALDTLRLGDVATALSYFHDGQIPEKPYPEEVFQVADYHEDRDAFFEDMRRLVTYLSEEGY